VAKVQRSLIVPYSAHEMFALAGEVDRYHEFLPWCSASEVLESTEDSLLARIDISYKGWTTSFTTRNRMDADSRILMTLDEGVAFESLEGLWHFKSLDELACEVMLEVDFSLSGSLGNKMLGPIFSRICAELIDAFVERAKTLYGERAFA
tara:strand:- start:464 stop:913 length:450 start_codon:yes stop_codon:yes gene_type:complete